MLGKATTFLLCAALVAGAATNIATGMNAAMGKAFTAHRMLAAVTMQDVGFLASFRVEHG